MKKISVFIVYLFLAFILAACSTGNDATTTQSNSTTDSSPPTNTQEKIEIPSEEAPAFTVLSAKGETSHEEGIGVKNGESVTTSGGGRLTLMLDKHKSLILDGSTALHVRKDGSSLAITLESGIVAVKISEKLSSAESFTVTNGPFQYIFTGTYGWIEDIGDGTQSINILEGSVDIPLQDRSIIVTDPESGEDTIYTTDSGDTYTLEAGQRLYMDDNGEWRAESFNPLDLPDAVREELMVDSELAARIAADFGVNYLELLTGIGDLDDFLWTYGETEVTIYLNGTENAGSISRLFDRYDRIIVKRGGTSVLSFSGELVIPAKKALVMCDRTTLKMPASGTVSVYGLLCIDMGSRLIQPGPHDDTAVSLLLISSGEFKNRGIARLGDQTNNLGGIFYNSGYIECRGMINNQGQGQNIGTIDVSYGYAIGSIVSLGNVICLESEEAMGFYIYAGILSLWGDE